MYLQVAERIEAFLGRYERILWTAVLCIAGIGIVANAFRLMALFIVQNIDDPVQPIYWMMGRALQNGLIPYEDIYETKPPGIFVVSALSQALFGSTILGNIIHIILLFSIPLLFVLRAREFARTAIPHYRYTLMAFAFIGATALIRYLIPAPTAWLLDFHAAGFGILYLLAIANPEKLTKVRLFLATVALFLTVGWKEPLFLSTLAGALLLLGWRRRLLIGWLLPAVAVAIAGVFALAVTGWLHPFFAMYLPSMFGGYVQRFAIPLYQRGVAIDQVFGNLATFSPLLDLFVLSLLSFLLFGGKRTSAERTATATSILLFLALFFLLSLTAPGLTFLSSRWILGGFLLGSIVFLGENQTFRTRFLSITFVLAAGAALLTSFRWCTDGSPLFLFFHSLFPDAPGSNFSCIATTTIPIPLAFVPLLLVLRSTIPLSRRFLFLAGAILLGSISLFYVSIVFQTLHLAFPIVVSILSACILAGSTGMMLYQWHPEQRRAFLWVATVACSLFITVMAVALGGDFQNQHFMAAVPLYAALLLVAIRMLASATEKRVSLPLSALLILSTLLGFSAYESSLLPLRNYAANIAAIRKINAFAQDSAERLDTILDHCNVDRYYIVKLGESDFNPFHGFTRHSPLNFFYWAGLESIDKYHPLVAEREIRNFNRAKIVILGDLPYEPTKPFEQSIKAFLDQEFTKEPWPCAIGLPTPEKRIMLYRRLKTKTE